MMIVVLSNAIGNICNGFIFAALWLDVSELLTTGLPKVNYCNSLPEH